MKQTNVQKFKDLVFDTKEKSTRETIEKEIEELVDKGTELGLDLDMVKAYIYFEYYVIYIGKIFETLVFSNGKQNIKKESVK